MKRNRGNSLGNGKGIKPSVSYRERSVSQSTRSNAEKELLQDIPEETDGNQHKSSLPESVWGTMAIIPVDTESKNYDLTSHITNILEKQAVSQMERLRCELAMRLQQINGRVDRALTQVGMSLDDADVSDDGVEQPSPAESNCLERRRRESMRVSVREHLVDSSERIRIMEELYEWFLLNKDFLLIDAKSDKDMAAEEREVINIAANIDNAMMNTLAAVGKIRRLGLKLLITSGFVTKVGRRRQPPKLVEERALLADYGKTLDPALGVVRKCHEELSKIVKSPMLKIWIVSARKQMKNLSVAVVRSFVQLMKLQQENLALNKKINDLTNASSNHQTKATALNYQLQTVKQRVVNQKDELRNMDKLLASAYQRNDYYEEKVMKMTAELEDRNESQSMREMRSVRDMSTREPGVLKAALKEVRPTSAIDNSVQTDDSQSSTMGVPSGLLMVERSTLSHMNQEISRLKKELNETEKQRKLSSQEVLVDKEQLLVVPESEHHIADPKLSRKEVSELRLIKTQVSELREEASTLLQENGTYKTEMADLQVRLAATADALKLRNANMDQLQRQVLRDFQNFLPRNRKFVKGYEDGVANVREQLGHLIDYIMNIYYDNKRMASYVRGRLDRNFPQSIKLWAERARHTLGTEALQGEQELSAMAELYGQPSLSTELKTFSGEIGSRSRASSIVRDELSSTMLKRKPLIKSIQDRKAQSTYATAHATPRKALSSYHPAQQSVIPDETKSDGEFIPLNKRNVVSTLEETSTAFTTETALVRSAPSAAESLLPYKGISITLSSERKSSILPDIDTRTGSVTVPGDVEKKLLFPPMRLPTRKSLEVAHESPLLISTSVGHSEPPLSSETVHTSMQSADVSVSTADAETSQDIGGTFEQSTAAPSLSAGVQVDLGLSSALFHDGAENTPAENKELAQFPVYRTSRLQTDDVKHPNSPVHRRLHSPVGSKWHFPVDTRFSSPVSRWTHFAKGRKYQQQGVDPYELRDMLVKIEGKAMFTVENDMTSPYSSKRSSGEFASTILGQKTHRVIEEESSLAPSSSKKVDPMKSSPLQLSPRPSQSGFDTGSPFLTPSFFRKQSSDLQHSSDESPAVQSTTALHTSSVAAVTPAVHTSPVAPAIPAVRANPVAPVTPAVRTSPVAPAAPAVHTRPVIPDTSSLGINLISVENVWEDLDLHTLPSINKKVVEAITTKWNFMKGKLTSYKANTKWSSIVLGNVESQVAKSSLSSKTVIDKLNEEKKHLKLQLINKEQMLAALLAEKFHVESRLKKSEKNNRHMNQSIASQTHKQVRKYSNLLQDMDSIRADYESVQEELRKMKSDYDKVMLSRQDLLSTVHTQHQQYERISNLHKHLIAKLEAYMLANNMMAEQKKGLPLLTDEQHKKRVDKLKAMCKTPDICRDLKKMAEALTEKLDNVLEGRGKTETFVQQYLELPGSKMIDKLRGDKELSVEDENKADNILSALSTFNKKLDTHVTNISKKLSNASQEMLDGQNLSADGLTRANSPEPGAPDGGERNTDKQQSLIRKELLSQTAKILPHSLLGPLVTQPKLGVRNNAMEISWPSAVTGTKCLPRKPEALWLREKSLLNEPSALTESDEILLDQLRTKWFAMDFKTGTKLENLKGPKHQARLKAVRGYCVDEKILPLPMTPPQHQRKAADPFEPDCYQITRCINAKYPKPTETKRENTIVYKSLNFVD